MHSGRFQVHAFFRFHRLPLPADMPGPFFLVSGQQGDQQVTTTDGTWRDATLSVPMFAHAGECDFICVLCLALLFDGSHDADVTVFGKQAGVGVFPQCTGQAMATRACMR